MTTIHYSLCLAALLCSSVFAETPQPAQSVNETSKSIVINNAEPDFQLRLPSNPTTGYSWFLQDYDHSLLHIVRNHYEAPQSTLLGAGGVSVWSFRAVPEAFKVPHLTQIVLVYMRPEDVTSKDTKTFTIVTNACHADTKTHRLHQYTC